MFTRPTPLKKNIQLCYKRNLALDVLKKMIVKLTWKEKLPENNYPHPLKGYQKKQDEEVIECHIHPDWLLVWTQNDMGLILLLTNSDTHFDLFRKQAGALLQLSNNPIITLADF